MMRNFARFRGALACAAIAISVAGGALTLRASGVGDAAAGRLLAARHCGRCHGIGDATQSPLPQAPLFSAIARAWPPDHLAEALAEGIVVGHAAMPAFVFSTPEIDDLLAYMKAITQD